MVPSSPNLTDTCKRKQDKRLLCQVRSFISTHTLLACLPSLKIRLNFLIVILWQDEIQRLLDMSLTSFGPVFLHFIFYTSTTKSKRIVLKVCSGWYHYIVGDQVTNEELCHRYSRRPTHQSYNIGRRGHQARHHQPFYSHLSQPRYWWTNDLRGSHQSEWFWPGIMSISCFRDIVKFRSTDTLPILFIHAKTQHSTML